MTSRGQLVEDPGILVCKTIPCPIAKAGDFIEVAITGRRARTLGFDETVARVSAVTPALHGFLIEGPNGQVIVGGHGSADQVRKLR